MKKFLTILAVMAIATAAAGGDSLAKENPVIVLSTSEGDITVELYEDKAPQSVQNFLWYVDNGFYDGLIFHRVIPDFMVQGGGFTKEMQKKAGNEPIENEATNGLKNEKGTLAMARTGAVHSATSQFFINLKDNGFLDHQNTTQRGFGYCVFGKVIDGKDVVDAIAGIPTGSSGGYDDVPKTAIVINKAYRKGAEEKGKQQKAEKESE